MSSIVTPRGWPLVIIRGLEWEFRGRNYLLLADGGAAVTEAALKAYIDTVIRSSLKPFTGLLYHLALFVSGEWKGKKN